MITHADTLDNAQVVTPEKHSGHAAADATKAHAAAAVAEPKTVEKEPELSDEQLSKITFTQTVKNQFLGYRHRAIEALPSSVVNHSSNSIAGVQVLGEIMMLKANGTTFIPPVPDAIKGNIAKQAWHYVSSPPKSVWKTLGSAAGTNISLKDFTRPQFYSDSVRSLTSLDKATQIEKAAGKTLVNRWQARSTFAGLSAMGIAALLPDVKDSEEDIQRRTEMRHNNPVGYVGKTIGEALWFPVGTVLELGHKAVTLGQAKQDNEIGKYKRQFTGLGLTIAGTCSFLSGFRNVGVIDKSLAKDLASNQKYVKNGAHSMGGLITALAGTQLLLAVGSDQGWERFGAIQWLRMAFLPKSITNRYKNGDPRANFYVGGQVGMQTANTASFLFGGAEKREDGTIVDNKEIRNAAKQKAKEIRASRHHHGKTNADEAPAVAEMPTTTVSHPTDVKRAMPERHADNAISA